jgi:DNA-binding FadR family transcriptional regulator
MLRNPHTSQFLQYLATTDLSIQDEHLPALNELSKELGVGISVLREQLEVARALGLVEVRPRTGIRRLPYSFFPAVQKSLSYAIERSQSNFEGFADLRNHLEASYWGEAVSALFAEDLKEMQNLMQSAWQKIGGTPVQIPHAEHRQLHLMVYKRLANPYVQGILEAYWNAYEAIGLNIYTDLNYLHEVWQYHQTMVDGICSGDFARGYQALIEHKDLLYHRPDMAGGK